MLRLHLPPLSLGIIAHLIGESCINLLLQLLLDIRVSGQNMQKEGKSTASGLIASKNKDNTLGHEFLVRESLKKKKSKDILGKAWHYKTHSLNGETFQ